MLEFTLMGVPLIFVLFSLFWMAMGMWQYHTIAEAVNATARTASVHGKGCAGRTCATTVGSVARQIASRALGISDSQMNVTLNSSDTGAISCNPLSNCYSNSTAFPSSNGNTTSTTVTISATYQFTPAISFWTPWSGGVTFNPVVLGANSSQPIAF
ncbi:MAG TPA: TadE family protein [Bryobacteraceae bacterium]|nr:TadE family protein [Bryobacteraceae bacterium]